MTSQVDRRFTDPFEVTVPPACNGWEGMHSDHLQFSREREGFDESRFWFQDNLHSPEPYHPFDIAYIDFTLVGFNQASSRLFVVPGSVGAELRVLNGYVYLSPNPVTDPAVL